MSDDIHLLQLPELEQVSAPDATSSSCFHKLEICEHLSLLPCFVGRLSQGISEHLNKKLLRYSEHYGGVLLAYSKPCVQQTLGRILDEQPHIHFDLVYTAYVFRPVIGSIVCGTVNNVGGDHVGCLVYDCFNASVFSKSRLGKESRSLNGMFTSKFLIGSKIWFRVITTDNVSGILSIVGEYFDPTELSSEKQDSLHEMQSPLPLDSNMDATPLDEDGSNVHAEKKKKRKAKRAKERKEDVSPVKQDALEKIQLTFSLDSSVVATGNEEAGEKTKRKYKRAKIQLEEESVDTSQMKEDFDNEASFCVESNSGAATKKKKRKKNVKVEEGLKDSSQNVCSGGEGKSRLWQAYNSDDGIAGKIAEKRKEKLTKKVKRREGVSDKDASQHDSGTDNVASASGKKSADFGLESLDKSNISDISTKSPKKKRQHSDISTESPKKKKKKLTAESCQIQKQHKRKR